MTRTKPEIVWAYLIEGHTKHALIPYGMPLDQVMDAVCLRQVMPFLPVAARWQFNSSVVDTLPECKTCAAKLKKDGLRD